MLYWVAAVLEPTKKEKENKVGEKLILEPTIVIAKDDKTAAMKTMMEKADVFKDQNLDHVQVFVRPF